MTGVRAERLRCALAVLMGVEAGGLLVAVATRAIPRVMSGMMAGMMQNMMPVRAKMATSQRTYEGG